MKIKMIAKVISHITLAALSFSLAINAVNAVAEEALQGNDEIIHEIKKGDTLWDISGEYLENPFLWSSIWEKNKYIKNPDLIFPGDKLVIPAQKPAEKPFNEDTAVKSGIPAAPDESAVAMEATITVSGGIVPPVREETEIPGSLSPRTVYPPLPAHSIEAGRTYVQKPQEPVIGEELVFSGGYIADRIVSYGVIVMSSDDRNVSAAGDSVSILLSNKEGKIAVGDRLTIYRPPRIIVHPETGKQAGRLFLPVGILEVYRVQGNDAGGRIVKSYDYISAGDQLQPLQPAVPVKGISQTVPGIRGHIIAAREDTMLTAERSIVFFDRGSKDGVTAGSVFKVTGEGTDNIIGELMVISVQTSTSTAVVTKSMEPFGIGSKVVSPEMK